jgi:hypothetical protein
MTLSIIVTMGFINQKSLGSPGRGDEFDHMAPAAKANAPIELIIVDRAWPNRWDRVQQALGGMLDKVKYIPPKPSKLIDIGYRAVNSMRNAGAIVSRGELLAFVDDYMWLDHKSIEAVWHEFESYNKILCPVYMERLFPPEKYSGNQEFSGHNPGIYMCSKQHFMQLGGFNENFDGAYGEADTEWQERLDRLLYTTPHYHLRFRRRGVIFRRTAHANGNFPEEQQYPWPEIGPVKDANYLRCNRAFYHCICKPRIRNHIIDASMPITNEELLRLSRYTCTPTCGVCRRKDRQLQIDSYREFEADRDVSFKMHRIFVTKGSITQSYGMNNPWSQ